MEEFPIPLIQQPQNEWLSEHAHVELGASALTYHLGFFKPLIASDELEQRLVAINDILKSIHDAHGIRDAHGNFTQLFKDLRLSGDNPVSVIKIKWHSMRVRLRFALHTEVVSLAIYIDVPSTTRSGSQDRVASRIEKYFPKVTTVVHACSCSEMKKRFTFLHDTIWQLFFRQHREVPSDDSWPFPEELKGTEVFGKFRGIIIRTLSPPLFYHYHGIVKALEPFLCCKRDVTLDDLVICEMKKGRALYFSRLAKIPGTQPHYLLVSNSLSPRELGGVVATGHSLGILRFAMIFPRNKLEEAAHKLRKIENEIDKTFESFSRGKDLPIEPIQKSVNEIRSNMFADLNTLFPVGVRNRLRQSILYKKRFDDLLPRLEISRHRNYRTYVDATNNALLPTLDRIEELLSYYEVTEADYVSLFQLVSSEVTATKNAEMKDLEKDGEFILFLFLVPYYGGMLFAHTLSPDIAERFQIWFWIFSVWIAFRRWLRKDAGPTKWSWRLTYKAARRGSRRRIFATVYGLVSARRQQIKVELLAIVPVAVLIGIAIFFHSCGVLKGEEPKPGRWSLCSVFDLPNIYKGEPKPVDGSRKDAEKDKDRSSPPIQGEQHYPENPIAHVPMLWKYAPPLDLQHSVKHKKRRKTSDKRLNHRRFAP